MSNSLPHHLEYTLPPKGQALFGNGHHHEAIFRFDVSVADHPTLAGTVALPPTLCFPHDFARLENNNVLIGFLRSDGPGPVAGDSLIPGAAGGIAAFTGSGKLLRCRILALGNSMPFEPRLMPDGSVLLSTYGCGFYRVTDIDATAEVHNVYTLDVPSEIVPVDHEAACGIPVVVDHYWIMAVGKLGLLLTLDIADPEHPRAVSRLMADSMFHPHWMAKDPKSNRIIVGAENGGENRMLMALVDPKTGAVKWDESFRTPNGQLGISFLHDNWPHGNTGAAFGHAALFRQ